MPVVSEEAPESTEKSRLRSCVAPWKRRVVDSLLSYLLRPKPGALRCRWQGGGCEILKRMKRCSTERSFLWSRFWCVTVYNLRVVPLWLWLWVFLKLKWQHGSDSESNHSRLMAVCKACPPKPKGVLTSSCTSSISPEGVSRFLRRRERQKWKIGSSMRTSICGLVGNENKGNLKTYWHTRPTCLEGSDQYFGRNMFSFLGCMVLCMYYVDYV